MSYLAEPVPPGFEDEMGRTAVVQKQIEAYNGGPLIGTEYVVELHENGQMRPDYFCVLCNTCNDVRSIFIHWTSVTHRTNYLRTHFQKAFELLQQLRRSTTNTTEQVLNITGKLVQIIEQQHGRCTQILAIGGDDFRRNRAMICAQVRDKFHYDECSGPDFLKEIRQLINETERSAEPLSITLDAISSDDDDEHFASTVPQQAKKPRKKQEEQQPAYRAVNRSPPPPAPPATAAAATGLKQTLPTPKELSIQASHIAQERYKWEKFRCMLELQLKQLRDITETYESSPEKHPDYSEEWKQFWNRRYKQLQEEKKCDPNSYDYKPEWISYWKDRRVELFNAAVNKIKKELQEKYELGDEDEENTKVLMERYKIRVSSPKDASAKSNDATTAMSTLTSIGARRKPNYRATNNRGMSSSSEAIIDISDDEQAPSAPSATRPHRRPPYGRSLSRSESPKRGRNGQRLGGSRRSRSRSPPRRRTARSRSRSRSSHRRSSRSPYSRSRDKSHSSRGHDDYDRERDRDRGRDDYYRDRDRDRSNSYSRPRNYDAPVETFRVLDSRLYPEYSQPGAQHNDSPTAATTAAGSTGGKELEEEPEGPITVITVLRMLSALEDHLGSLGPRALNMLSKALAMEKIKPNAADDLLLNEDNCVLMETIKEKLKGILIAEVLDDPQKVRVVKKIISNIATVIFQVTTKGKFSTFAYIKSKDYQLPYDRQLVSSKLANALIINGVDDVSVDDMNRLLHFFTLLVKAHQTRRQTDRSHNSGLNFDEVLARLGLNATLECDNDINTQDIDLKALIKQVESQLAAKDNDLPQQQHPQPQQTFVSEASSGMESLTDSDLQTLLQNFKFLSNEEQVHLISHLRKLEVLEPARVERLRKYVNVAELSSDGESCSDYLSRVVANVRPTAAATAGASLSALGTRKTTMRRKSSELQQQLDAASATAAKLPSSRARHSPNFMLDDDDDDDYNFDDLVMKANDSNANGKKPNNNKTTTTTTETMSGGGGGNQGSGLPSAANALTFKPAAPTQISLKDTENIIANLMGTLANNSSQQAVKSQQQQNQQQRVCFPGGRYYDYEGEQSQSQSPVSNPTNNPYHNMPLQQQQQQQMQQPPAGYNMNNFNAYPGYGVGLNPWANGPPQAAYNNVPQQQQQQQQNYMPQQPQPPYNNNNSSGNNMFGGHH
ncbi:hypothetical protein KR044_007505 [Drosophila immigrans]|nr:hypothetical protein KR044_007505 [Drosophila immigrans]